jgi:hypothetical protein
MAATIALCPSKGGSRKRARDTIDQSPRGIFDPEVVALQINLDKTSWLTRETFTAQAASFSRC